MYSIIKRMLDILLSLSALLLLWPVFLGIAIVIKLTSPGPVLFRQKRVGKGKRLFEIINSETMRLIRPKTSHSQCWSIPDTFISLLATSA